MVGPQESSSVYFRKKCLIPITAYSSIQPRKYQRVENYSTDI